MKPVEGGCASPSTKNTIGPQGWGPGGYKWPGEGAMHPLPKLIKLAPGDGIPGDMMGLGRGTTCPPPHAHKRTDAHTHMHTHIYSHTHIHT